MNSKLKEFFAYECWFYIGGNMRTFIFNVMIKNYKKHSRFFGKTELILEEAHRIVSSEKIIQG